VLIDKHYRIWLGNPNADGECTYSGELFGFNTGSFEFKVVRQHNKRDVSGVAWRVVSDMDLIIVDKVATPLCRYLHSCAVNHGLGEVSILEHVVEPKLHAAVAGRNLRCCSLASF
jgi:hypothetical protein